MMATRSRMRRFNLAGALSLLMLSLVPANGQAQQRIALAAGDTVSFSVVGSSDLNRTSVIGPDGMVQVPLAGAIPAQGKTLAELQSDIAIALGERPYRIAGADGEETWRRISANELLIDIANYRPIYVTGDVGAPGEYPFLPGMTVRQAVAKAGGFGASPASDISELQLLNLATQRDVMLGRIDTTRATLTRLELDLAQLSDDPSTVPPDAPGLDQTATSWLQAREAKRAITTSNTQVRLEQLRNRLDVLRELERSQTESMRIENEELARTETLAERGVVPAASVSEARRVVLQMSMQVLETTGEIHRLELDIARTADEIGLAQSSEEIELLTQLASERAQLDSLQQQLVSLEQRLVAAGGGALLEDERVSYTFTLYRADAEESLDANDLTSILMLPGDVLDVTSVPLEVERN